MARQDNETKKRCLYVDIGQDGSLQQPSDIGEAAARDAIASRTGLVALVEAMTAHQTMLALGTIPAELRAEVEDVMRRIAVAERRTELSLRSPLWPMRSAPSEHAIPATPLGLFKMTSLEQRGE